MPAPSTFDDVVQLRKAWFPPNSGSIWRTAFRRSSSARSGERQDPPLRASVAFGLGGWCCLRRRQVSNAFQSGKHLGYGAARAVIARVRSGCSATEGSETAESERSPLQQLKMDPGGAGLDNALEAISKLQQLRELKLPQDLFRHVAPRLLQRYRQRAAVENAYETSGSRFSGVCADIRHIAYLGDGRSSSSPTRIRPRQPKP
jgi:hypothetical protein